MPRRTAAAAAETRETIVAAARRTFGALGYAGTTLDAIAAAADLSRGAVHHHFGDKRALFVEVFTQLEEELNDAVAAAALAAPPHRWLRVGLEALFDFCTTDEYRQISLSDAPAVLGLAGWYEIDRGLGMPTFRFALDAMVESGRLERSLAEPLAVLLFGALTEATIVVSAGVTTLDRSELLDAFDRILAGLVPAVGSRAGVPC